MNKQHFFDEHYLNIEVLIGKTRKRLKDVTKLREGSIVEFDKLAGEPLDILVDGEVFAKGEAVAIDENYGIRVTEVFEDEEEQPRIKYVVDERKSEDSEESVKTNQSDVSSEEQSKEVTSPEEIDEILSKVASNENNKYLQSAITSEEKISDNHESNVENNEESKENHFIDVPDSKIMGNSKKSEILTQDEIDQLLTAISTGEAFEEDFEPVIPKRKIRIYDFKHPIKVGSLEINALGNFMHKFCSILPTVINQQLSFKLESISQILGYECYEDVKTSFIDQWKWYSSDKYFELSVDDFVINQLTGIKKQGDFYSKKELSELSAKISSPFMDLLYKSIENYTKSSDIPEITHVYSAPTPEFLLSASYENAGFSNSFKKEYVNKNSSMYLSLKIKVSALSAKESSGYIFKYTCR